MIIEGKLTTEKRNSLGDGDFGLPEDRKYPLNDKSHVELAIRFFNYCPDHDKPTLASNINKSLKKFKMKVNVGEKNTFSDYIDPKFLNKTVTESCDIDYSEIPDEYIDLMRNWLNNQLYIINQNTGYSKSVYSINAMPINMMHQNAYRRLDQLRRHGYMNHVFKFSDQYTFDINKVDVLKIFGIQHCTMMVYDNIIDNSGNCKKIWFAVSDDVVMCCLKNISQSGLYIGVVLTDELLDYVTRIVTERPVTLDIVTIEDVRGLNKTTPTTEGVTVNAKGDVKITIGAKKSYMDEYMEAHRILVENNKNKNYDAMKTNIAFLFSLISIIERDKKYKDREPEVVKARAFAINDFKTYLKIIQDNDPKFDFVEYYKKSDFDKTIINIPKHTIQGIISLFKLILK